MSEIDRIRDQLERAYRGEAWHGPSLRAILGRVGAGGDRARPISGAHSIRELVLHILTWENEAVARLDGRGRDELPPERDWPDASRSWKALLEELDRAHEQLMAAIGELDDDALARRVPGNPGTVYHLLHGIIQHNLYHAGQIALLQKAL